MTDEVLDRSDMILDHLFSFGSNAPPLIILARIRFFHPYLTLI
jgi:hypothetical protein